METLQSQESYFVLKEGGIHGPLSMEALRTGRRDGQFSDRDLVQSGDLPLWQPLSHVVAETPAMSGVIIPEWKAIAHMAGLRLRHNLRQRALGTAMLCLLAALLVMAVSQWSFLFWGPWLVVAGWAAVMLITQRREVAGTVVLLAALAIPFTRAYLATQKLKSEVAAALSAAGVKMGEPWAPKVAPVSEAGTPPPQAGGLPVEAAGAGNVAESSTSVLPVTEVTPPALPVMAEATSAKPMAASSAAVATTGPVPPPATAANTSQVPPWERPAKEWEKSPLPPGAEAGAPAQENQPDFIQGRTDAFIIVKGAEGSGSGFMCRSGDKTYLYSNIHVVAGMDQAVFTRLGNAVVTPGAAEAAGGPDIVRFAMPPGVGHPLELMTEVDNNVRIGDAVVVLGNSGGGGVVTSLKGEIRGIGPDRIEVSAEFIPGNSGSPIIHVKSGKVIGIATYLTKRFEEFAPKSEVAPSSPSGPPSTAPRSPNRGGDNGAVVIRRFGYRIDTVTRWEPINWAAFRAEAKQMDQVTHLTEDIVGFLGAMRTRTAPQYNTDTLRRPAISWLDRVRSKQVSENDRLSATQRFLGQLRAMVRTDVQAAEATLRYSYFRNELKEQQQVREQLYQVFNAESVSLSSPSSRPGYR